MLSPFQHRAKNIALIATSWCLGLSVLFIQISTTTFVVTNLLDKTTSTLPIGFQMLTSAASAVCVPLLIKRFTSRIVFQTAFFVSVIGGGMNLAGVLGLGASNPEGALALLVLGAIPQGFAYACVNNLRFAVTNFVPPETAPRAISMVVFAGALAAVLGPEVAKSARHWLPVEFAGSYLLIMIYSFVNLIVVSLVDWPDSKGAVPPAEAKLAVKLEEAKPAPPPVEERPLFEIIKRPVFIYTLIAQVVAFCAMVGPMTATPVGMQYNGLSYEQSTNVIQGHVVGMFAPAILTPFLMAWLGLVPTAFLGFSALLGGICGLFGGNDSYTSYIMGNLFVGIGWSWSFVPASALLVKQYTLPEKAKVQSLNDGTVFGCSAVCMVTASFFFAGVGSDWFIFVGVYVIFASVAWIATIIALILDLERTAPPPGVVPVGVAKDVSEPSSVGEKHAYAVPNDSSGTSLQFTGRPPIPPTPPMPYPFAWGAPMPPPPPQYAVSGQIGHLPHQHAIALP